MTMKPAAREPDPMQLTETQIDNYRVRPEFFTVRKYHEPITAPFHGQSDNDANAAQRSMEQRNRGSIRAQGNVNQAGPPHLKA